MVDVELLHHQEEGMKGEAPRMRAESKGERRGAARCDYRRNGAWRGNPRPTAIDAFYTMRRPMNGRGGLVMGAPPHVESWGGARCGSQPARARGRRVWVGGGSGVPLGRVPSTVLGGVGH
jgi:hypothetical protein